MECVNEGCLPAPVIKKEKRISALAVGVVPLVVVTVVTVPAIVVIMVPACIVRLVTPAVIVAGLF